MKKVNNQGEKTEREKDFIFFNEHIDNKSSGLVKTLVLIILLAVIFGLVSCFVFFETKPFVKEIIGRDKEEKTDTNDENCKDTEKNPKEPEEVTQESTKSFDEKVDTVKNSFVTLTINEKDEWESIDSGTYNFTCGIVLTKGNGVKILTKSGFYNEDRSVSVYFGDVRTDGKVFREYPETGIMIVQVDKQQIDDKTYNEINTVFFGDMDSLMVGKEIMFVGNPYGREKYIANGSLTSVGNTYNIVDAEVKVVTTDISGTGDMNGFVYDMDGNVVGMVNDMADRGSVGENVITFFTHREAYIYLNKLLGGQQITYLGIQGKAVTEEVIETIDNDMPYGIYITSSEEKSPAYNAGIMSGDILTAVDGRSITDFNSFTEILQSLNPGDNVDIAVMRKGKGGYKEIHYSVELGGK